MGVRSLVILLGFACQCLFAVDLAAAGEKYPSRPVHFVVGFTAGGPNDIVARILSATLASSSWSKTGPVQAA